MTVIPGPTSKGMVRGDHRAAWVVRLLAALAIPIGLLLLVYNPAQLRWGASDAEVARGMPGDSIQPHPIMNATRAITIAAPAQRIWPWLVQIGYKRAGWYGYDALDNAGVRSAEQLIPDLQKVRVGDVIPILDGVNYHVVAVDPDSYLVIAGANHADSMVLALYPIDGAHTRLLWRYRSIPPADVTSPLVGAQMLTTILVDFVAVRENMMGIKSRAEGAHPPTQVSQDTEISLWVGMLVIFVAAEALIVLRRSWLSSIAAATSTGLVMVGITLAKPDIWVDFVVLLGTGLGVWWVHYSPARPKGDHGITEIEQ